MKDARGHGSAAHQAGIANVGHLPGWGGAMLDQVRRFASDRSGRGTDDSDFAQALLEMSEAGITDPNFSGGLHAVASLGSKLLSRH